MTEDKIIKKVLDSNKVKRPVLKNTLKAFISGGIIALIGQGFLDLYMKVFKMEKPLAVSVMSVTMVFLAALITGFGIYDRIGQFSGAGTIVPITGFSNSMTASAIESKSEGIVLGIMTNMFKLAGSVIVAGAVSAFVVGTILFLVS